MAMNKNSPQAKKKKRKKKLIKSEILSKKHQVKSTQQFKIIKFHNQSINKNLINTIQKFHTNTQTHKQLLFIQHFYNGSPKHTVNFFRVSPPSNSNFFCQSAI